MKNYSEETLVVSRKSLDYYLQAKSTINVQLKIVRQAKYALGVSYRCVRCLGAFTKIIEVMNPTTGGADAYISLIPILKRVFCK